MLRLNQKGFIETLGSDLPSLIPIAVGLMLFFATLSWAMLTVNARNAALDIQRNALELGEIARGDGMLSQGDLASDGSLCKRLQDTAISGFVVAIVDSDTLDNIASLKISNNNPPAGIAEYCLQKKAQSIDLSAKSDVYSFVYPIVYQNPSNNDPTKLLDVKYLAVIEWKT